MSALMFAPLRIGGLLAPHPLIPASALALVTYGHQYIAEHLAHWPVALKLIESPGFKASLKALIVLGLIRLLNRIANRTARNNWRLAAQPGWEWSNEIAVITGGCNGIGKSVVLGLVQKGVTVVILDVQDLPADLKNERIVYRKCDVTSSAAVQEAADEIRKTLGHPSILINNAGIATPHSILETTDEYLSKIFGVNTLALWYTTRQFLPNMVLKNKGHIITVASIASFCTMPTTVDYAATKAGALAFHEGLSGEIRTILKAPGVITSVVHPFWTRTGMTTDHSGMIEKAYGGMMKPEDISQRILEQIWSCRGGQLVVPGSLGWLAAVRGLPNWVQELIIDISGKAVN